MGLLARYISGLCVAVLGLCAAGWLVLTPVAFGYLGSGPHGAALTDRATGAGLAVVSLLTLVGWVVAWRRKLRADGVLTGTSRRQARREARELRWAELRQRELAGETDTESSTPDPAQVLSELRALLIPLLARQADGPAPAGPAEIHQYAGIPQPRREQESSGTPDGFPPPSGEPDYYQLVEPDRFQHAAVTPPVLTVVTAPPGPSAPPGPPAPVGIAAIESVLAGAELLMVGCGEEEAW
jgi:hypothetical protein